MRHNGDNKVKSPSQSGGVEGFERFEGFKGFDAVEELSYV